MLPYFTMQLFGLKKVHIVPVGFELDRVTQPLAEIGADRVYLLVHSEDNPSQRFYLEENLARINETITSDLSVVPCDIWDLTDLMRAMCAIICKEKKQENIVLINASSGNKLASIAGTIAGMMYGARLYYAKTKDSSQYNVKSPSEECQKAFTRGPYSLVEVPEYTIEKPGSELICALHLIMNAGQPGIRKYELAVGLGDLGVFDSIYDSDHELSTRERRPPLSKNTYGMLKRNIIQPLESSGWIKISGSGKKARILITRRGKNILRVFEEITLPETPTSEQ